VCLITVRISECRGRRHVGIDNRLWTVYIVLRQNVQWIPENRRVGAHGITGCCRCLLILILILILIVIPVLLCPSQEPNNETANLLNAK
jgi:hypothetical protein